MSRRSSRRRQQAMNARRRDQGTVIISWGRRAGRATMMRLWEAGIPFSPAPGVWMVPPDPQKEREEFVRQLTARVQLEPGEPEPMRGEVGLWQGMRIISSAERIQHGIAAAEPVLRAVAAEFSKALADQYRRKPLLPSVEATLRAAGCMTDAPRNPDDHPQRIAPQSG